MQKMQEQESALEETRNREVVAYFLLFYLIICLLVLESQFQSFSVISSLTKPAMNSRLIRVR